MNDFRKSYQQMMNDIPAYSIDADSVLSEARHRKAVARRRKQAVMSSVFTLCLVCLLTAGTVTAADYFGNVIRATDKGFVTGDKETMERAEAEAENAPEMTAADEESAEPAVANMENESEAGIAATGITEEGAAAMEKSAMREYTSIEAFESAEPEAVIALPDIADNGAQADGGDETRITVAPDNGTVMFHYITDDDRMIFLHASNYADSLGHSSNTVYGDDVTDEREYITEAGYTYILLETRNEEGELSGLHAAIAVGTYEIIADFWGYSEEESLAMIESMDLTVYLTGGEN